MNIKKISSVNGNTLRYAVTHKQKIKPGTIIRNKKLGNMIL